MNQNLLSRVLEFLRRKMWSKRWQRAVTCFSAVVVFCVTYALILPAITMTGKYPVLSAETLTAWTGDELTVRVSAETAPEDGGKTVVLTLEGEGADLSEKYVFNDEGVCPILDEEENEILLHRAIREDAKNTVDYWFDMEPGTKTVFALDLADKVDVTRFAETMEAVKQSGEEAKPETQKATAADAGKSAVAAEEAKTASASNAARTEKVSAAVTASGSNADIEAVNQEAKTSEEKVLAESHDNGFVEILDGQVMNDLEEQENEEATEIVAEMKVSAGIGGDYEKAVADAGKNADKRGDAQLKLRWKDAVLGTNSVNELTAAAEGAVIAVFFDEEAGIPQGAVLSVEEIDESTGEYQEYLGQASAALKDAGADDSEDSIRNITHARFFDITIRDADGNEIEPKSAVKVVVSYNDVLEITEDGSLDVLHFTGSEPEVLKPAEMSGEKLVDGFSFSAETFSVYGIVGTETLTAAHFTADGKTYEVSVKCGAGAAIPKGAKLLVSEVTKDDLGYDTYKEQTTELVQKDASALSYLKMLDISIVDENGIEITPAVPVDVQIRLLDKKEGNETRVIHIGESAEELDSTADGKTVNFATPGFSVFVFVDIDELPDYSLTQSFENEKFRITAAYSEKAGIPEDAEFRFAEITPETDGVRYEERKALLSQYYGDREFLIKELLNMGFWKKAVSGDDSEDQTEEEIEPAEPVLVSIILKDADLALIKNNLEFVHFTEDGPEVIVPEAENPQGVQKAQEIPIPQNEQVTLKVDSFSDFAIVTDPGTGAQTVTHTPPTPDESNVQREGSKEKFLENLPYGTCYVDYDLMEMYLYTFTSTGTGKWTGTYTKDGYTYTCKVTISDAGQNLFTLRQDYGGKKGIGYTANGMNPLAEWECDGLIFTVEYDDVAYLHDGRLANVVVTGANSYVKNTADRIVYFSSPIFYGNGILPCGGGRTGPMGQGVDLSRIAGGFDLNIKVTEEGEDLSDETFLYGMQDIDIDSKIAYKDTFRIAIKDGELVGIKIRDKDTDIVPGYGKVTWGAGGNDGIPEGYSGTATEKLGRYFSIPIAEDEKVPLYDEDGAPLYFKAGTDHHELTRNAAEAEKDGDDPVQGYPLYKTAVYVRGVKASPYAGGGSGQDDGKAHFRFWLLTMEPMCPESETIIDGVLGEIYVPETNWLYINGYDIYGTRDDNTDGVDGTPNVGSFDSGYFLLANAETGLTYTARSAGAANSFLTNSRMALLLVSRTYPGGTISTSDTNYEGHQTAYGVHCGGDETGYKEGYLSVPYNKAGVTYTMTPDNFYHIKEVQIWDGINSEYPASEPSAGETPYTSGRIDLRDESRWVNNTFTHTTEDGRVYTFTRDANGIVSYVFNDVSPVDPLDDKGVKKDHWIYVWWEKDPTVESVKLIKKWNDNGNARGARPDPTELNAITMHLVRSDGGYVNPETETSRKIELVTGTDENVSSGLKWVDKPLDNRWEYIFEVEKLTPSSDVIFQAWEDAIPDYECKPGTGNDGRDQDHKKEQDADVVYDPATRTNLYTITIENKLKNGGVSFNKKDQFGRPVAGAVFTLYYNPDCNQPAGGAATATSAADTGVVTFNNIPCGIYYMKETTVPAHHTGSSKVYQVTVHAADNPNPSTIVPGTVSNHIFTPDGSAAPISDIDNPVDTGKIKVTKTVLGDEAARSREFDFTADFGQAMANKQITVDKTDGQPAFHGSITLDQEGKYTFKLKDGGSIEFSGLPHGLDYTITEDTADGFETTVEFDPNNAEFNISGNTAAGTVDTDQEYTVAYTNKLLPDILIRKTDSGEVPQSLAGSKFKLYKFNETSGMFVQIGEEFEIPADGRLWEDLEPGLYKLEEVLAPTGYVIINRETEFTVRIPTSDDNSCIAVSEGVTWAVITASDTIAIQNQAGVELPATGGPGTTHYTLGGLMLLIISALLYGFRKRHEERRAV